MAFIINDPPSFTTNIEQWDRETLADGSEMAKVIEKLLNNEIYNKAQNERQDHVTPVTLTVSGWTGNGNPYKQEISVEGLTEEMEPSVMKGIPEDATIEFIKDYNKAFSLIYYAKSANGKAVFQAYKKPTVDILIGLKGV